VVKGHVLLAAAYGSHLRAGDNRKILADVRISIRDRRHGGSHAFWVVGLGYSEVFGCSTIKTGPPRVERFSHLCFVCCFAQVFRFDSRKPDRFFAECQRDYIL